MRWAALAGVLMVGSVGAQEPLGRVYVKDGQIVGERLQVIDTVSWDDTPKVARVGEVECIEAGAANEWLRLKLEPQRSPEEAGPLTIAITYLDNGPPETPAPIVMQFDCADPARMMNGAWAWTAPAWGTASGQWLTAYWTIEKPGFTHRELGADFGISGKANRRFRSLYVSEVAVTRAAVLLSADVKGLALDDNQPATITAQVIGLDGKPAPDGTPVTFGAVLGECDPAEAATAGGKATTTFRATGPRGEAIIQASCGFSSGEMKLPVVPGSGGVTEMDWVVADFEDEETPKYMVPYQTRGVAAATVKLSEEAAHTGLLGAALDYEGVPDAEWFNAGVDLADAEISPPGVLLGLSFWAKMTEPNMELRWALYDAREEHWNWFGAVLEEGENGWRRHGSTTVDAYFPNRDVILDYPLAFHAVYVPRSPWAKAQKGTLYLDDIVAHVLVSGSEAEELRAGR